MEINFNPYTANVLDYVGKPLVTVADGKSVRITQAMNGAFTIWLDRELFESGLGNIAASSVLNRLQCKEVL